VIGWKETLKGWQQFGVSILFVLILPLIPLLIERGFAGKVEPETLVLIGIIYPISISASSPSILLFSIAVMVSIFLSIAYGIAAAGTAIPGWSAYLSIAINCLVFIVHGFERYNKHVRKGESFLGG
jgi:hypothetical protein